MTLWLNIGMLLVIALSLLLRPLLHEGTTARGTVIALLVGLPLSTASIYLFLGAPEILEAQALVTAQGLRDEVAMLSALERKLEKEPEDAEGWYALGRSYVAMQRLDEAESALSKAIVLAPKDARLLSQQAEILGLKAGSLEGRPQALLQKALEIDPDEEKALELAGLSAFQREEWAQSLYYWRRLLKKLPRESEFHEGIAQAVKLSEQKAAEASGLGDRARLAAPEKHKQFR